MKFQQKNYFSVVLALFMGCMFLFNSCTDDSECGDIDCGLNGTCIIDNGVAICQCDSSDNGVLLYNGTGCENCIAWGGQCPPNSTCTEEGCLCDEGYVADTISGGCVIDSLGTNDTTMVVDSRDVYVGSYLQSDENCTDTTVDPATLVDYATVDVTLSSTVDNQLIFSNLSDLGDPVVIQLREDLTRFDILEQTTPNGHYFKSLTIGTINTFESSNDTILSIQYTLTPFGGVADVCELQLVKQ